MWDVFISYASEDKDALVRELAEILEKIYTVSVWYDEFSLEYGDSLTKSIQNGLKKSKYGVVIFSKYFFKKTWTDKECISLQTKEMLMNQKLIIPVWYGVSREEVAEYDYSLADKFAISITDNYDIDDIAIKIIKIIRPDIYNNISRMKSYEEYLKNAENQYIDFADFKKIPMPPVRHKSLSIQMKARLKLIYNAIKSVDKRNYHEYEEDFRRSINIDRELIITELLTAAYLDCTKIRKMSPHEKTAIYGFTMVSGMIKVKSTIHSTINYEEQQEFKRIIDFYINDIDTSPLMEYKFLNKDN